MRKEVGDVAGVLGEGQGDAKSREDRGNLTKKKILFKYFHLNCD